MKTDHIGLATVAIAVLIIIHAIVVPYEPSSKSPRQLGKFRPSDSDDPQYSLQFEECKGKTVEECETLINQMIENDPSLFGGRDHLVYVVHEVRQKGERNYHKVGLMTDMEGNYVIGLNGDGVVKYTNPDHDGKNVWCIQDKPCKNPTRLWHIDDKCCFNVGPWDCDADGPMTVEECCNYIQSTIPGLDFRGNMLECNAVYPLGSEMNPVDRDRVYMRVNAEGRVIGEPKNE